MRKRPANGDVLPDCVVLPPSPQCTSNREWDAHWTPTKTAAIFKPSTFPNLSHQLSLQPIHLPRPEIGGVVVSRQMK